MLPNCLMQGVILTQSSGKCSQTIWQLLHSSAQVILAGKILHQLCLFVLANQMKMQASKTKILATFCTCYSSQMPFLRLKSCKSIWNMSPSRFVSTVLHKSLLLWGKIQRVLHANFEYLFWQIKCMHWKFKIGVYFFHCFASIMPSLKV